jgi:hypothetical protein
VRLLDGVLRTETLVVLSTQLERTLIPLGVNADAPPPARRANGSTNREARLLETSEALDGARREE